MIGRISRVANTAAKLQRPVLTMAAPKAVPLFTVSRSLHTSTARQSDAKKPSPLDSLPSIDSARVVQLSNEAIAKLQGATTQQLFHWTTYGLAGLAPVAIILSPHLICFPVDFALGLVIPAHMHIGLVGVVEDYVPRPQQGVARIVLAVLGVLTAIGLLKVNLCGAGITESVKSLWRRPKPTPEEKRLIKQQEQERKALRA